MPCILKIRVYGGRDLPVMDWSSELTDAYVELRLAGYGAQRTSVCRKTLNPIWNEDFRFEVNDESDLQNEPLEIKVLDYDTITSDNSVGVIFIDLNPLLSVDTVDIISGWFPVFDTLLGVRGEINVSIKLDVFEDANRFKESSTGVLFLNSTALPNYYTVKDCDGFVEELVLESDPEYHWSDSFRTNRSSNEARQRLFCRLSGQLRRLLGKKVLEMGCNAVVGFRQCFDFEGQRGIVVRGAGTACKLLPNEPLVAGLSPYSFPPVDSPDGSAAALNAGGGGSYSAREALTSSTLRRQNSLLSSDGSLRRKPTRTPVELQLFTLEYFPRLVVRKIGGLVSAHAVKLLDNSDREVRDAWWTEVREEIRSHARLLGCHHVIGYQETAHIQNDLYILSAIGTAAILNWSAYFSSASPTRANSLNRSRSRSLESPEFSEAATASGRASMPVSGTIGLNLQAGAELEALANPEASPAKPIPRPTAIDTARDYQRIKQSRVRNSGRARKTDSCRLLHLPYSHRSAPFPMHFSRCLCCKKRNVPELLLATIEPPPELNLSSANCGPNILEAFVCRSKKNKEGESNATFVSETIPFIEYDLHRQLIYKLKMYGLNAVFGLRVDIHAGDELIVGCAYGTGVFLPALPTPQPLQISADLGLSAEDARRLTEKQKQILEASERSRQRLLPGRQSIGTDNNAYRTSVGSAAAESSGSSSSTSSSSSSDESSLAEIMSPGGLDGGDVDGGTKASFVVRVDDKTDQDVVGLLVEQELPAGIQASTLNFPPSLSRSSVSEGVSNTPRLSGVNSGVLFGSQHLFAMRTTSLNTGSEHQLGLDFAHQFRRLFEQVLFAASFVSPCIIGAVSYQVYLPKDAEVQTSISAMLVNERAVMPRSPLTTTEPTSTQPESTSQETSVTNNATRNRLPGEDMIFDFEGPPIATFSSESLTEEKSRESEHLPPKCFVELCPFPYVPGAKIEKASGPAQSFFRQRRARTA